MNPQRLKTTILLLYLIGVTTAACPDPNGPEGRVCRVICCVHNHLLPVAQAMAAALFVYAGARYAYSADDPEGKKEAKTIAFSAVIGLMIMLVAVITINNLTNAGISCAGVACL